jgi:threonine/homoserine/homoserine lactone efflux protein
MTDPLAFALAIVALLATPGPTNTLLFTAGAMCGARSLRLIPAEIGGYLVAILTIGFLVAPVVTEMPTLGALLRLFAVSYLAAMAIRLWRHAPHLATSGRLVQFRHVFITTALNPKALLFAFGIIPLNDPNAHLYLMAFCLLTAGSAAAWAGLGTIAARGLLPERGKTVIPRLSATIVLCFAGYLVTTL